MVADFFLRILRNDFLLRIFERVQELVVDILVQGE